MPKQRGIEIECHTAIGDSDRLCLELSRDDAKTLYKALRSASKRLRTQPYTDVHRTLEAFSDAKDTLARALHIRSKTIKREHKRDRKGK